MKYFTPRLYAKLNSSDAKQSLAAHAEWERAEARYDDRLRTIHSQLPKSVRFLADELCLHDALFLGCFPMSEDRAVVNVRTNDLLFELDYRLVRPVVSTQFTFGDLFVRQQPRWLYDEIELIKPGWFSHEILLSNGLVLKLVFQDVEIGTSRLKPVGGHARSNGSNRASVAIAKPRRR